MAELPIRRMILYKHGVGYVERRGTVHGEELVLTFARVAMDDVLKSLIAIDLGAGQIHGIDFETPEDRQRQINRGTITLSDNASLLNLLRDLRGQRVRITAPHDGSTRTFEGLMLGIDLDDTEHTTQQPLVSLYDADTRQVRTFLVRSLLDVTLLEDRAATDLTYFLDAWQQEEERRAATIRLSAGDHDLLVGYLTPAPAWRVSYRLLLQTQPDGTQEVFIQGWGLFDNQFEEDLNDVELTLVAGMPISFRYRLYEPHTPERPLIADEERTVSAPIGFDAPMMAAAAPMYLSEMELDDKPGYGGSARASRKAGIFLADAPLAFSDAIPPAQAQGEERGALFQYRVIHPVSVGRGKSAMAPILSERMPGRRKLIYNGEKHPVNPVATLHLTNVSALTLERGPVTVLEEGDYAGEAVVPFTRAGAELIVGYAIELGISVLEQPERTREIRRISIKDSALFFEEWAVDTTTYTIRSSLREAVQVQIEQTLRDGFEPGKQPRPAEQSGRTVRWDVSVAPNQEQMLVTTQRRLVQRQEDIRHTTRTQLVEYLRTHALDQQTFDALEAVWSVYQTIDELETEIATFAEERKAIGQRQKQARENLSALGTSSEETALRSRYVAALNQSEDRLQELDATEQQLRKRIDELEEQADEMIALLNQSAENR